MTIVRGYDLKQGERVSIEFMPLDKCPVVGNYVIRVMERVVIRDSEGKLVKDLLKR